MFREIKGNMFDRYFVVEYPPDAFVITTNGFVKANGEAVMGRGVALEARKLWISLPSHLGKFIRDKGNNVHYLGAVSLAPCHRSFDLVSFPVKHNWWEKADLKLIKRSTHQLIDLANEFAWESILMPRPGCGNGKLDWETEVKPILLNLLDERFTIISKEEI